MVETAARYLEPDYVAVDCTIVKTVGRDTFIRDKATGTIMLVPTVNVQVNGVSLKGV